MIKFIYDMRHEDLEGCPYPNYVELGTDAVEMGDIMEVFKSFLVATSFSPSLIDKYFKNTDEEEALEIIRNQVYQEGTLGAYIQSVMKKD